jgi:RNA polymerase sigma-70 factor (ECF subfamily)
MSPETRADALARWRDGDFEAFLDLVRPHLASMRALVAFCGLPPASLWDCDDVAQEALLEAFGSADRYDPSRGDLRSWLAGIVRNRVRRAWQEAEREQRRHERARFDLSRRAARPAQDTPADAHIEAVRRCLEKVPPPGDRIVRAHYVEGLSGAEIAARLRMSVSAVYVALHRLRRALRRCVEETGGLRLEGSRP